MSRKGFIVLALMFSVCSLTACNSSVSKSVSKEVTTVSTKSTSSTSSVVSKADSSKPTVILFYAQWCGYCKTMFPLFQELQAKYKNDVNFFYIDIDSEKGKALSLQYRTKQGGVPDTQFYNAEGKLIEEFLGASSKERIESNIKNLLH